MSWRILNGFVDLKTRSIWIFNVPAKSPMQFQHFGHSYQGCPIQTSASGNAQFIHCVRPGELPIAD